MDPRLIVGLGKCGIILFCLLAAPFARALAVQISSVATEEETAPQDSATIPQQSDGLLAKPTRTKSSAASGLDWATGTNSRHSALASDHVIRAGRPLQSAYKHPGRFAPPPHQYGTAMGIPFGASNNVPDHTDPTVRSEISGLEEFLSKLIDPNGNTVGQMWSQWFPLLLDSQLGTLTVITVFLAFFLSRGLRLFLLFPLRSASIAGVGFLSVAISLIYFKDFPPDVAILVAVLLACSLLFFIEKIVSLLSDLVWILLVGFLAFATHYVTREFFTLLVTADNVPGAQNIYPHVVVAIVAGVWGGYYIYSKTLSEKEVQTDPIVGWVTETKKSLFGRLKGFLERVRNWVK